MSGDNRKLEFYIERVVQAVSALAFLRSSVRDRFFTEKLAEKIKNILNDSILLMAVSPAGDNVAQYAVRCAASIDSAIELAELVYVQSRSRNSTTPLLVMRSLLKLRLALVETQNSDTKMALTEKRGTDSGVYPVRSGNFSHADSAPVKKPARIIEAKLSANSEKILGFIRDKQEVRTKDVVDAFTHISDRTVKRVLKELIHIGSVKKQMSGRAVFYSATQ